MVKEPYFGLISLVAVLLLVSLVACNAHDSQQAKSASLLDEIRLRKTLNAGVKYDSKPFGFMDVDGKVKGFDVDLIREIARRILGPEGKVEFQQVLSSTRIIAINSGNLDVVAATMTITPERREIVDFSDTYFTAGQGVVVRRNAGIRNIEDLHLRKILFVIGSTSEKNIKKRLPFAKYTGYKSATDAFSSFRSGRGEAMTTDDTILSGFISESCDFVMLSERLSHEPYGLAFRKDPYTRTFREKVNEILKTLQQDGTMGRLNRKWLGGSPAHCEQSP